jgi:DNA topoisomerase-1
LACTGYPKCRSTKSINAELRERLKDLLPPPPEKSEKKVAPIPDVPITETCPECDAPLKLMKSRFGPGYYLACSKWPKCKGKAKISAELQRQIDAAMSRATSG